MAHAEAHVKGVESEYANRLLAVLPFFISDLPCYNPVIRPCYNTVDEYELKTLRSSIHFEIRLLHVTLSRGKASLVDDAFVGCLEVLKSLLDLLETLLRSHTVPFIATLIVS
jgi:hypothetical protein